MSDDESTDIFLVCHESITSGAAAITCTECAFSYHAGNCSGVAVVTVRSKPDIGTTWLCATCKGAKLRSGQKSRNSNQEKAVDISDKLAVMNVRIAALLPLVSQMNELMTIKETVRNIETAVENLSANYDTLLLTVDSQTKDTADLKARVENVECSAPTQELIELKKELDNLEQYSHNRNLEIHGLEHTEGENLLSKLNSIGRKLNIAEVTAREIEAIHRLPSKPDKVPIVLVRLESGYTKEKWAEQRPLLKIKEPDLRFFDNLTPYNKNLLWMAETRAHERSYQFAWQKNGKVLVKRSRATVPSTSNQKMT
ncbi:hypothetical protein HPB48_001638 [Haemaphysalis longicornis]|uniref:FP protein C-terminal domain-containing protein n=1 Tax=Haemaphysalis longicornis TaxID=44386 RepID=A0A9J6FWA5_HAELO|nr:hypothetical protein HPB48_001638 [Haemaphysalis longicornis]